MGSAYTENNNTTISDETHSSDGYELTKEGSTAGNGVTFTVDSSGKIFYVWSSKSGNTININNGGSVTGSGHITNWIDNKDAGVLGGVNYNVINIKGAVTGTAYGGYSSTESVSHNSVTISGSNAKVNKDVFGGYSAAAATDNTVKVTEGNKNNMVGASIYGGFSTESNVERNTVEISDVGRDAQYVVASGFIYGGKTNSGKALKNSVTIRNSKVANVYGGYSESGDAGGVDIVNGNTVTKQGNIVTMYIKKSILR